MSRGDDLATRYARRAALGDRYSILRPEVQCMLMERQRATLDLLATQAGKPLAELRAVEVGCGSGGNLLDLLRWGLRPERLCGIELLPERAAESRAVLPQALRLIEGDATTAHIAPASQDLVLAFTVFSSLLDDSTQHALALAMWRWLAPGGAVLAYDFAVDNPRNRDVRGVPLARWAELFPEGTPLVRRVTLAPPLARAACRLSPRLYPLLNALPLLRTHRLLRIAKPASTARLP
ncbi:MAG: class I SAM-dependent methyltransferase [Rubrivivax sp.]|nr:class I SAM-dependent methyltransferase [Rubrivivax sp.]